MKNFLWLIAISAIASTAAAESLVCKGGILSESIDRFSTLSDNEEGALTGYKADASVGGYMFKVVPSGRGLDLTIAQDDGTESGKVIAKSWSASRDADLTVPIATGLEASVFCADE